MLQTNKIEETNFKINKSWMEPPKIRINPLTHQKIMYWVHASDVEISGLGTCRYNPAIHAYEVIDAWLLDQENGPTTTDIDPQAAAKLMYETRESEGHLNFWWHSHVNMGVFWSGTDEATIQEMGLQGLCVATVFNKKGEMRSAAFIKGDETGFRPHTFLDKLDTQIGVVVSSTIMQSWHKEFSDKCKKKTYTIARNYTGYQKTQSNTQVTGKADKGNVILNQPHQPSLTKGDPTLDVGEAGMLWDDPDAFLGFESLLTFNELWDIFSGETTYARCTFLDASNYHEREDGVIHPTSRLIYDDDKKIFTDVKTYLRTLKMDPAYLKAPFSLVDWRKYCDLYEIVFRHPPVWVDDVVYFLSDVLDITTKELESSTNFTKKEAEDYRTTLNLLAAYHEVNNNGETKNAK